MKHILIYLFKSLCFLNTVHLFAATTLPVPPMPVTAQVSGIELYALRKNICLITATPFHLVPSCNFLKYLKLLRVHGHNKGYIV